MSTILLALGYLKDEIDRVYALDVDAFREHTRTLRPIDLVLLLDEVDHCRLERRLFEETNPEVVSEALEWLPYESKAKALKYMSNEQRLLVVETWSLQKNLDELRTLNDWQRLGDTGWEGGIADTRIMTGPLPDHYPLGMDRCASCGNSYPYWVSIVTLNCMRHSSCEACLQEDGVCLHCDPSFG